MAATAKKSVPAIDTQMVSQMLSRTSVSFAVSTTCSVVRCQEHPGKGSQDEEQDQPAQEYQEQVERLNFFSPYRSHFSETNFFKLAGTRL